MNLGSILILLAFLGTVFSAIQYFRLSRLSFNNTKSKKGNKSSSSPQQLNQARLGFYIMAGLVTLASALLFYFFLTHQFQYRYVYGYSSRDLPLGFLISSFWAGQEGSLLFWTLMLAWLGVIFMRTSRQYELNGMLFLNIIMGFFLAILIKASPFATFPQIPVDGAGLNPLLQNFWMVIHPPVLFVGYAAASFPFVLALAALIQRDYDGWLKQSLSWTAFTTLWLGAGIILGAFWAYETLGWGGYWGWDPVENSSLIPWLTVLALLHGLIVQKTKGSLKKTNFVLAIITFVLVIYATFLTRSGVLADFSVHSFSNLGINSYLIVFMVTHLLLGFGIYFIRQKDIPFIAMDKSAVTRENGLLASVVVFCASAFLTFLGTSSPIITGFLGNPQNVETSFYNQVNLPVGILMALLLGIIPFFTWIDKNFTSVFRRIIPSLILTILAVIFAVYMGITNLTMIVFTAVSAFAFWTNLLVVIQNRKKGWHLSGAPLTHVGVGIVLISIIVSDAFDRSQRVVLEKDQKQEAMNYALTYKGLTPRPDGKDIVNIEVEGNNRKFLAQPRLYFSPQNRGMMREPHVDWGILKDVYISPLERRADDSNAGHNHTIVLIKGETKTVDGYAITFHSFHMSSHADGSNAITIGAELEIEKDGKKTQLTPHLVIAGQQRSSEPLPIDFKDRSSEKHPSVALMAINADDKAVQLMLSGFHDHDEIHKASPDILIVELSIKPFMNILWAGSIILLIGAFISLHRRIKE